MRIAPARRSIRTAIRISTVAAVGAATVGVLGMSQAPASSAGHCSGGPTVSKQFFGQAMDIYVHHKLPVFRYTLANCAGMQVRILTYGGTIQSINVPGRNGRSADVVLGFATLHDYVTEDSPPPPAPGGPYFGETIGRYGNRIAKGTFHLNGHKYTLPINNGVNSLHGGFVGFGNHVWAATAVQEPRRGGRADEAGQPER